MDRGASNQVISDMDDHGGMRADAKAWAAAAIENNAEEKAISKEIKTKFDEKYGPTWHVIVGTDFKAYVSHESKHFIFFYSGKMSVCIFRAG